MLNRHLIKFTLLAILFLLPVHPSPAQTVGKEIKNVIVIGWDAAGRTRTKQLLEKGELPTLAALIKEGHLLDIDVVTGATDTKAGWSQLLTGYVPEKTGVYNNGRYEPIPEGYTVFERLEKFFGPGNIDTVAIIAKKSHVDNDPPYRGTLEEWTTLVSNRLKELKKTYPNVTIDPDSLVYQEGGRIVDKDGRQFVEIPGKPWYRASKHMDLWVNGLGENEKVAARAISELEKRKDRRFFFFIHFAEPDHRGHKFGENSQEYARRLLIGRQILRLIINKLKALGLYEKTMVYIIADHGFDIDKKNHLYAPFVFAATNDPIVVRKEGTREDIAPTILKKFGLDLSKIEPRLDGYPFDVEAPVRKANPEVTPEYRRKYNYIDNKKNNAKKVITFD